MALVYQHFRKDNNELFYIGIGKKYKRAKSTSGRNKEWRAIANSVGFEVEILIDNISWELACEYEIILINFYGRKHLGGLLVNMTEGGDGSKGHNRKTTFGKIIITKDNKEKRILAEDIIKYEKLGWIKGRSEKCKINNSKSKKGQKPWNAGKTGVYSKNTIEKFRSSAKNRIHSDETKYKMSIAQFGNKHPRAKTVLQYDINNNFIAEYETASEAQRKVPKTSKIHKACMGIIKTSGGYIWKYK
jgi:hypothetical protein